MATESSEGVQTPATPVVRLQSSWKEVAQLEDWMVHGRDNPLLMVHTTDRGAQTEQR